MILLRAIRDMNMPKFIAQDMPLFNALMSDLFPGVEPPTVDYGKLQEAIEAVSTRRGCSASPPIIRKCIQCYESKLTRHGNMLVGASLGGKTRMDDPSRAMSDVASCKEGLQNDGSSSRAVRRQLVINPKADLRPPTSTASTTCRPSSGPTACSPR